MINFKKEAEVISEEIINIRRDIHQNPELGFEEYRTSSLIKKFLEDEGIKYTSVAGTGVCGIIEGNLEDKLSKKKIVALRADIDALPILEKNDIIYKSQLNGKMHACGHDAHTAILLGAAKILNKHKDKFSGIVKLLFEPAEETVGGAKFMIKEGVLDNPNVDIVIGLHVEETLDVGKIMIKNSVVNAASNPFSIKVYGKGGHGAYPHMCVDPIVIAAKIISNLQTIVSREIKPINPVVITVGSIKAGEAANVIPDEAILTGIIRTMTKEDRAYVVKRVYDIATTISTLMGGSCKVDIEESYPSLYNDNDISKLVRDSAAEIIGKSNVIEQENPKMGVESFAYFAMERRAAFYFLGVKSKDEKIIHAAHSPRFNINEDAIPIGIAIQCLNAFNYLTK